MRIISKTYILVGILIAIAAVNLFILYGLQQESTTESYSIIRAGDLKQKTETISSLASSIANGNDEDREKLKAEINEFENYLETLKEGGELRNQEIVTIPNEIFAEYNMLVDAWNSYKNNALVVQDTSVFDEDFVDALNYVLDKNEELILQTHNVKLELDELGRDYNRHKQIVEDMERHTENFGRQVLLLSIGEEEGVLDELKNARVAYEIDIRKLTGQPTSDLTAKDEEHAPETLIEIPRANSQSLRDLEPLWEAVELRIKTLEESSLLSTEFQTAKNNLESSKNMILSEIDVLLDAWNEVLNSENNSRQTTIQTLTIVDIIVFGAVVFVIRQSLNPLEVISRGLSRVKEGIYGEKINYKAKDEVGELVDSFNIMSDTIKEKEEEARKNDIAKDEFLAMITHELKTPLVPIQGYADLLLSEHLGTLTDKQKERLAIIKSSATSLLDIISDLLDAQKLELGQLKIKKETSSIKDTVTKAVESMQTAADEKGVKLAMNCPDVVVLHDSERIHQVLTNLLKNALTAVKKDTGAIQINVGDYPDQVKISVNDNGVGIPADKQKDLFKKFYQVDATLTRERGGSGLGLAIVKGIVDAHGGKIGVQSTPDVGTTFTFTIPKNNHKI
ncbi:MAG TPA: HAMP domain-containing sensor histidine kinase [Nitrosopumilaceae archaeon]|nr:HAMP domain-containing sensor histidine kinase [Nitrosopumilaceae archaeon]